jgi:hypothetical protein
MGLIKTSDVFAIDLANDGRLLTQQECLKVVRTGKSTKKSGMRLADLARQVS